ncbi:MAG: 2Fe-2S iron-sulfur cluster-binding protein [Actinomycetota bacterium]
MSSGEFTFDGRSVEVQNGDRMLDALVRAGVHPTGGGTLCFGGDCANCVCTVDGVAYVRACQEPAEVGVSIASHGGGAPPLPSVDLEPASIRAMFRRVDVVVIGGGEAGQTAFADARAASRSVVLFDVHAGEEVLAVYSGPLVLVRTRSGIERVACDEVIVATGAAEIQPIVPGSDLRGLWTARGAEQAQRAGARLDALVAVGHVPESLGATALEGDLVRFVDGGSGAVAAVVTRVGGTEIETPCENVIVSLGLVPRNALARMSEPRCTTVVGDAAREGALPAVPTEGVICPCSNVTVSQLDDLYSRGFHHMELLKRSSLAGTGTCQGSVCTPYLRSLLHDRGQELQPAFTARPMGRQATLAELAAGSELPTLARTALDGVHRELGARMDRMGGWWRPWSYGDVEAECGAVRERVSIGDTSTLGKMILAGPDAEATLQGLFPTDVSTIRPGRSRYALMLNERGYVMDDGMIARESDGTFFVTFTSSGASMAEMWIRDWSASWGHDIRLLNQTTSVGTINVTGPQARVLLERLTDEPLPPFLGHVTLTVGGIDCKVFRLSFTGELSYELHHGVHESVALWNLLMEAGADLGIEPHGLDALSRLRLEKGHIIVGQDTDYDSSPRRLQHEWAVNLNKGDFIGRTATVRTNQLELDKKLVGFEADGPLREGAVAYHDERFAGTLTSTTWSPALGRWIAMGWLQSLDGAFPESVMIDGVSAAVRSTHFYDPEGSRPRA